MKNLKFILFLTIIFINLLLVTGVVFSQGGWLVGEDRPPAIGPEVSAGQRNNLIDPDATWVAPDNGLAQFISYDHDTKCNEKIGYVQVEATVMPIPTAPFPPNGSCADPVDYLWASIVFSVAQNNLVSMEQGGTSGRFFLEFITATPSPTATATAVDTATPTPTATPTEAAEPPETVEPTATPTLEVAAQCIKVVPERLGDGSYLIWVDAENPTGYTLFDGTGYLFFEEQPIAIEQIVPGIVYRVTVGDNDTGCEFQLEPTGLPTDEQPGQYSFHLAIPFLSR